MYKHSLMNVSYFASSVLLLVTNDRKANYLGPDSIQTCTLTCIRNLIEEIRRTYDRLISTMEFSILLKCHLHVESVPEDYKFDLWMNGCRRIRNRWRCLPMQLLWAESRLEHRRQFSHHIWIIGASILKWSTSCSIFVFAFSKQYRDVLALNWFEISSHFSQLTNFVDKPVHSAVFICMKRSILYYTYPWTPNLLYDVAHITFHI